MNKQITEVRIFEYIEETDSFAVEVNQSVGQYAAAWFVDKWEAMKKNEESGCMNPQSVEDYCFAMIYEIHFKKEPLDLCYTFYRVHH